MRFNKYKEVKNKIFQSWSYLMEKDSRLIISLIILGLLIQIPKIYLDIEYARSDFIEYDSAVVFDGASNIHSTGSYEYDTLYRFIDKDGNSDTDIEKAGWFYPPLLPILLGFVLSINNTVFTTKIFNLILYLAIIPLYFVLVKSIFNSQTGFFSTAIILFNPLLYMEVFRPVRTHVLSLFLIVLFFTIFYRYRENKNRAYYLGFIAGLCYLTRDINLVLFLSFILYSIFHRELRKIIEFSSTFFVLVLPWWINNYKNYDTINPRSQNVDYIFPPAAESSLIGSNLVNMDNLITSFLFGFDFLLTSGTIFYFYIFLPFCFLGISYFLFYKKENYFILFFSLSLCGTYFISPLLSSDSTYLLDIYFLPVICLCMPFGVYYLLSLKSILVEFDPKFKKSTSLPKYFNCISAFFVILILLMSSFTITNETLDWVKYEKKHSDYSNQFDWAVDNIEKDSIVSVSNTPMYQPIHFTHYTDIKSITLPTNLNPSWLNIFITTYGINYIFLQNSPEGPEHTFYDKTKEPYNNLFNGNTIQLESYNLDIVHTQEGLYGQIIIYEISEI